MSVRRVRGLATASLWALGEWARDGGGSGIWVRGLATAGLWALGERSRRAI